MINTKKSRKALIVRDTRETQIRLKLALDGKGIRPDTITGPFPESYAGIDEPSWFLGP